MNKDILRNHIIKTDTDMYTKINIFDNILKNNILSNNIVKKAGLYDIEYKFNIIYLLYAQKIYLSLVVNNKDKYMLTVAGVSHNNPDVLISKDRIYLHKNDIISFSLVAEYPELLPLPNEANIPPPFSNIVNEVIFNFSI